MGPEDPDRRVKTPACRLSSLGLEDGGDGRPDRLADRDEIVHGDPPASVDRDDPLGPLPEDRGVVRGDDTGDGLEEGRQIGVQGPKAEIAEAVSKPGIAGEGDLEDPEADLGGGTPEAVGIGGPTGAHVARRKAERWVTHGRQVYRVPLASRPRAAAVASPGRGGVRFGAMEPEPGRTTRGAAATVAAGAVSAASGAALVTLLGTIFDLSVGLLVVAFFVGRFGALAVAALGAVSSRRTRAGVAVGAGLLGVALGQIGLWLVALAQGGTLDLASFLAETYGVLVPAELGLAVLGAWWPFRR